MANLKSDLTVTTPRESFNFIQNEPYNEVFTIRKGVDNSDGFTTLYNSTKTAGTYGYKDVKAMVIRNTSNAVVELQLVLSFYQGTTSATKDTGNASRYISIMLKAGEYIYLPGLRAVGYDHDQSVGNAGKVEDVAGYDVASALYVDSGADLDDASGNSIIGHATRTTVQLENYTDAATNDANLFYVGDFIRVDNEIMKVTEIGDKSDLANNKLTVIRGVAGSTAATDGADDDPVRLRFFNTQEDFDKYTYVQTNNSGRLTTTNLLGYGRNTSEAVTGIVPGSVALKFYTKGYQELGLSGITPDTDTGLTAGTTYQFKISVDGTTAYDVDLTIDSSNTKFGGTNGFLQKLNTIFSTQSRTSGSNLFEKYVSVGIVNGDIRFTSQNRTRISAIELQDSSGGDTDMWGVGRIPAVANVNTAIAATIPPDTILDRAGFTEIPNTSVFTYDNGHGRFVGGEASGSINYETGAIDLRGPANAEPIFNFRYNSGHSGGNHYSDRNVIGSISARSMNAKTQPVVELVGFN